MLERLWRANGNSRYDPVTLYKSVLGLGGNPRKQNIVSPSADAEIGRCIRELAVSRGPSEDPTKIGSVERRRREGSVSGDRKQSRGQLVDLEGVFGSGGRI